VKSETLQSLAGLSGQSLALHRALIEKGDALAGIYLGALRVLNGAGNPDAIAQAAHSLRELLDKLPKYFDLPFNAHKERLGDKARALKGCWERTLKKTVARCQDGSWQGPIDDALCEFLQSMEGFCQWQDDHMPRRKTETAHLLREMDQSGRRLPGRLEDWNVQYWTDIRDYFVAVCHHRPDANSADFKKWLDAFEVFLLNHLRPRTFEEHGVIDAILEEGMRKGE
jgi:hypothetical protein